MDVRGSHVVCIRFHWKSRRGASSNPLFIRLHFAATRGFFSSFLKGFREVFFRCLLDSWSSIAMSVFFVRGIQTEENSGIQQNCAMDA
jgi:hypothetical protein